MAIEQVAFCPLGKQCEEIKDSRIYKCAWLITLKGVDPATGENIDQNQCAVASIPIMIHENAKYALGTARAVDDFKNEMVKAQESSKELLLAQMRTHLLN
jgi:hypothetical protein